MIGLSKTSLSQFKECARCFWLAKNKKLEKPRSPMPSVVNGIDAMMKEMVNRQGANVPFLDGMAQAPHPDRKMVEGFRGWRTFQAVVTVASVQIKLWGELDDLLVDAEGRVSPWDFKSKGNPADQEYCDKWYTLDGDLYQVLLEGQGLMCTGKAYLTFAVPKNGAFEYQTIEMETKPDRALQLAWEATACLERACPLAHTNCSLCRYIDQRGLALA
jgi:hypothetical protein